MWVLCSEFFDFILVCNEVISSFIIAVSHFVAGNLVPDEIFFVSLYYLAAARNILLGYAIRDIT